MRKSVFNFDINKHKKLPRLNVKAMSIAHENSSGPRMLFVTDYVPYSDIDDSKEKSTGVIFGNEEGQVLFNLLGHVTKKNSGFREVVAFNWYNVNNEELNDASFDSKKAKDAATRLYANQRLRAFIRKMKPDVVCFSGMEAFNSYMQHYHADKFPKKVNFSNKFNRLIELEDKGFTCKYIGTMDIRRAASQKQEDIKKYTNLLGFVADALNTARRGENRYNVKLGKIKITYIDSIAKFEKFYKKLCVKDIVSIDSETLGLKRVANTLFSIQFSFDRNAKRSYFLPIDHPDTPFTKKELAYIKQRLADYFEKGKSIFHIYQNGKFDIQQFLQQLQIRFYNHKIYDVMAGEYALDENRKLLAKRGGANAVEKPFSLDAIAEYYGIDIYSRIAFSKGDRVDMTQVKLDKKFITYSCIDTVAPILIVRCQLKEAEHRGQKTFKRFILRVISNTILAIAQMEHTGAYIDKDYVYELKGANSAIDKQIKDLLQKIKDLPSVKKANRLLIQSKNIPTGFVEPWVFNINKEASKQMLFFNVLKLEPTKLTKKGTGAINKDFKKKYKDLPEVKLMDDYEKLKKLKTTYVDGFFKKLTRDLDCRDSKIRSDYIWNEISTGRLGSRDPNLQNIISRGDLAKTIKRCFIAQEWRILFKNDYSAHEVRGWANLANDIRLSGSFDSGLRMRRKLRILINKYRVEAADWRKFKDKHNWDGIKVYEEKKKLVDNLKNKAMRKIAALDLQIEVFGDIHKLNCVVGSTLIPTNKGLVRIDSLDKENKLVVGGRYSPAPLYAWQYNGKKKTIILNTELGNKLNLTGDHEVLVFDNTLGETVYKQAKDCKPGDLLCMNPKTALRSFKLQINLTDPVQYGGAKLKKVIKPKYINTDLAFLLGCMVAEGHIQIASNGSYLMFSNTDKKLAYKFIHAIKTVFGIKCAVNVKNQEQTKINGVKIKSTKPIYCVSVASKAIAQWFIDLGCYHQEGRREGKVASHFKVIPWSIMQSDAESQKAFIAAYLECDGRIDNAHGRLEWFSTSEQLITELQILLNAHGVFPKRKNEATCKKLTLSSTESLKIWPTISKYMVSKNLICANNRNTKAGVPVDYWRKLIASRQLNRDTFKNDAGKIVKLTNWIDYTTKVKNLPLRSVWAGYEQFKKNLKLISKEAYAKLDKIIKSEYVFNKITTKTKGKIEKVYDLTIKEGYEPSFIANGFVIHNCQHFWGTHPLKVTADQRQAVKAVVFGVIYGKCVLFDSIVPTSDGLLTIGELRARSLKNSVANFEGYAPYKTTVVSHENKDVKTSNTFATRGKTWVAKTMDGDEIEGLPEHRLWIMRDKRMQFVRLDELEPKDWLPKSVGTDLYVKKAPKLSFKVAGLNSPSYINEEVAKLFGLFVAEGCRNGVFYNHSISLLRYFKRTVKNQFEIDCTITKSNGKNTAVNLRKKLTQYFNHYLGTGLSEDKYVPEIIRCSPKNIQKAFLQGLWEGDGSVWRHKTGGHIVEYSCISKALTYQMKAMLENMGVHCYVVKTAPWATNGTENQKQKVGYKLKIKTPFLEKFQECAGFISGSVKAKLLKEAVKFAKTSDHDDIRGRHNIVPANHIMSAIYNRLEAICGATTYSYTMKNRWGSKTTAVKTYKLGAVTGSSHAQLHIRNGGETNIRAIQTLKDKIKKAPTNLHKAIENDKELASLWKQLDELTSYYWTQVSSVKSTGKIKDVGDLSVPGPQSYHVNGLIGHNTAAGLAESLGISEEKAQELIDLLFEKFKEGGDWIKTVIREAQKQLFVLSPAGMIRHLWAYLHNKQGVRNAMDRRGPNSIIQGLASQQGVDSMRNLQVLFWNYLVNNDVENPLWKVITNYVHDSVESENWIHMAPLHLYFLEHASTTLVHKNYEDIHGMKFKVGLEVEFQMGPSMDKLYTWKWGYDELREYVVKTLDWQKSMFKNPNHDKIAARVLKAFEHNLNLISKIRAKELKRFSGKHNAIEKTMLMKPHHIKKLGFITNVEGVN